MTNRTAVLAVISLIALTGAMGLWTGCSGGLPDKIDIFGPTEVRVGEVVEYTADVTGGKFVVPKNGNPSLDTSSTSTIVVTSLAGAYQVQRGMLYYLIPYYTTDFEENSGRCTMTPGGQFVALAADLYSVSYRLNGRLVGLLGVEAYLAEDGKDVVDINDGEGNDLDDGITITIIGGSYLIDIDGYAPFTIVVNNGPLYVAEVDAEAGIYLLVVQPGTPAGSYPCIITITDSHGNVYVWHIVVIVPGSGGGTNVLPVASMSLTVSGMTVTGNASGSTDPDGLISSYNWNWGDGTSSSGATASHTYTVAGTYTITLTVTDNNGGTSSQTATVVVTTGGGTGSGTINVYPEEV